MFNKNLLWASLTTLGLFLGTASATIPHAASEQTSQFKSIDQPLEMKVGITIGGLALIGLELWWFMLSKSRNQADRKGN